MDLVPENVHAEGTFVAFWGSLHVGGPAPGLAGEPVGSWGAGMVGLGALARALCLNAHSGAGSGCQGRVTNVTLFCLEGPPFLRVCVCVGQRQAPDGHSEKDTQAPGERRPPELPSGGASV